MGATPARGLFRSIVCGVDGSPSSLEGVRQAARLAAPDAAVTLVAVSGGVTRSSILDSERARMAVQQGVQVLSREAITPAQRVVTSREPIDALLEEARAADLLVVSSHGRSRTFGILLGSTATALAHRAHVPLLVARQPPPGRTFLDSILVATDGRPESDEAVEIAGGLAARERSRLALVHVEDGRDTPGRQLAEHTVRLIELTGIEPVVLPEQGPADNRIVEASERVAASLIVLGARNLSALGALGSVSERVAHDARCSVLIARPR